MISANQTSAVVRPSVTVGRKGVHMYLQHISSVLCKDVSTSLDHLATCVPCQSGILALDI